MQTLTVADIDRALERLQERGVKPVTYKGKPYYLLPLSLDQTLDLAAINRIQRKRAKRVQRLIGFNEVYAGSSGAQLHVLEVIQGAWHRKNRRYTERRRSEWQTNS